MKSEIEKIFEREDGSRVKLYVLLNSEWGTASFMTKSWRSGGDGENEWVGGDGNHATIEEINAAKNELLEGLRPW